MGRAKHSSEIVTGGATPIPFSLLCLVLPFFLFSLKPLEFRLKLNFFGTPFPYNLNDPKVAANSKSLEGEGSRTALHINGPSLMHGAPRAASIIKININLASVFHNEAT